MSDKQLVGWVDSCGLVGNVICEPIVRSTFLDNPEVSNIFNIAVALLTLGSAVSKTLLFLRRSSSSSKSR